MNEQHTEQTGAVNAVALVQVVWQGRVHTSRKPLASDLATNHHAIDRAIWDATVEVRRALVLQRYPHLADVDSRRVEFRNEFEAFGAIRAYLSQHPHARFELVPPGRDTDKWRAYFKLGANHMSPFDIEMNPPVGIGSTDYVAIENLLRFTEGRDTIDG
jgi:hypothetical protein